MKCKLTKLLIYKYIQYMFMHEVIMTWNDEVEDNQDIDA